MGPGRSGMPHPERAIAAHKINMSSIKENKFVIIKRMVVCVVVLCLHKSFYTESWGIYRYSGFQRIFSMRRFSRSGSFLCLNVEKGQSLSVTPALMASAPTLRATSSDTFFS